MSSSPVSQQSGPLSYSVHAPEFVSASQTEPDSLAEAEPCRANNKHKAKQSHPHPAASGSPVGLSSWGTSIRPCRRWIAPLRVNTRSSLPFPFSSQYPPSGAADPAWHPPCRRLHCQLPSILPSNFASSPDPLSLHSTDDNWLHCQEHLNQMCSRVTISKNLFCFLDKYHTRVYDITVHVGRNGTSKRNTPLWIWQMGAYVWSNPISWFGNDFGLWSYLVCLMVFLVSVCFHCITTLSFGDFSIYFISFFILMVDHLFFLKSFQSNTFWNLLFTWAVRKHKLTSFLPAQHVTGNNSFNLV